MVGTVLRPTRAMLSVFVLLLIGYDRVLADDCKAPIVEVLVSPMVDSKSLRVMGISWDVGDKWMPGDWVGLYNSTPSHGLIPNFKASVSNYTGYVRTGVQEGRKFQPEPDFTKKCQGWWVAYWRIQDVITEPVVVSCLTSNPTWMEEMSSDIGAMSINNIFLPGTHDSGAFQIAYSPFAENRINKYIITQDETILEQLIFGARVLDLRIALHENNFWVNHGIARIHPLEHLLYDINTFVNNTKEIVILDIHEFLDGFDDVNVHFKLIDYIKSILGQYMAPPSIGWRVTPNYLWTINKRVIVAYNDKNIVKQRTDDVWWPVSQKWGNKRTVPELYDYFDTLFKKTPATNVGVPWSAMVELTASPWDIFSDKLKGLRNMADQTNQVVVNWFRGDWGNKANIVAVDFIRSSGVVESAIRWNKRKAKKSTCD